MANGDGLKERLNASGTSSFAIDWKIAILAGVLVMAITAGVSTAILEGSPLVTKQELAARDSLWQVRLDALASAQTAQANAGTSTNTQLTALALQVAGIEAREADDRAELQELKGKKQTNLLEKKLRQKEMAEQLNRESYERQLKAMEAFARKQAVGL